MPSLNKAFLIGHVGGDPSVQTLKGGSTVARFSLAVNYGEKVEWLSIVAWDKLADVIEKYIRKGSAIFIEGRIQTRKYETKEGESRTVTEIVAQNIQLLDRRESEDRETKIPEEEQTAFAICKRNRAPDRTRRRRAYRSPTARPEPPTPAMRAAKRCRRKRDWLRSARPN